jgi:hypothetical protein
MRDKGSTEFAMILLQIHLNMYYYPYLRVHKGYKWYTDSNNVLAGFITLSGKEYGTKNLN